MATYKEIYEQAVKSNGLKPLTPRYMKWEKKGDVILGAFKSKTIVTSSLGGGEYYQYLFDTDEGLVKFALGRSADAEIGIQMIPGHVYLIEYLGKVDIDRGRRVNRFSCQHVGVAEDDTAGAQGDLPF